MKLSRYMWGYSWMPARHCLYSRYLSPHSAGLNSDLLHAGNIVNRLCIYEMYPMMIETETSSIHSSHNFVIGASIMQ